MGPPGLLTGSLPMRFYLCERAVRGAFGMLVRAIWMTALGPTSDVDRPLGYAYEDVSACLRTAITYPSQTTGEGQQCRS